ncbi:type I-G CRISPR-associated protein Csb2 [Streptomyces antarcticus]|uniref:type I-G CRISPR-associated protein Csb2 n=1 Tax=Streptomyces antarcticus TaxID=2996458 RepID=UPI002270D5D6|nr:type I-U CRISPR-associated protein Csb2 [Streptomyces sp. H34-AA3]MCY0945648.1 type I-U CRISPR-associated protein Csb2 [Streptomyces sp. H34-AA3]
MPFRITVHLLDPAYQASTLDRGAAEWPPHPYRVFCGLVSVADPKDPVQDAALQWLEQQPAPTVRVPEHTAEAASPRGAWVPTNAIEKTKPSHGVLPGRTAGGKPKVWPERTLAEATVEFEWPTEPPAGVHAVLEMLAKSVPYIGRATGHAFVHAAIQPADENTPDEGQWQVWEPADDRGTPRAETRSLRTPHPGLLEGLRWAYEQGQSAYQQARPHPYVLRGAVTEDEELPAVQGPFSDLLSFAFPPGFSLDPALTLKATGAFRSTVSALLDAAGHDVDAMVAVHGHKAPGDDRRLCAFVAYPFVGHRHADGRLRGVGVALPADLDPAHRRALLAILLRSGGGLSELAVPSVSEPIPLTYISTGATRTDTIRTVRPQRWTRPSREWTTALPMVLDLFPKGHGREIEASVAASCRLAGLPEPVTVEVLHSGAYTAGAPTLPARALRRKADERPLPARHVRLRFAQPVTGPVLLGSKKNYGLGLCLPTHPGEKPA